MTPSTLQTAIRRLALQPVVIASSHMYELPFVWMVFVQEHTGAVLCFLMSDRTPDIGRFQKVGRKFRAHGYCLVFLAERILSEKGLEGCPRLDISCLAVSGFAGGCKDGWVFGCLMRPNT